MSKINNGLRIIVCVLLISTRSYAQELYVFTEPASNMPAHSLSIKQSAKFVPGPSETDSRHTTELMFGLNKNWMVHTAATFSNMYSNGFRWEAAKLYAKYRFLSNDGIHSHFRMAAFAEGSYSRNNPMFDELSIDGDQSGMQFGVIATQLLHKLAVSSTVSITEIFQDSRWQKVYPQIYPFEAFNYTLSAGYLVFPKVYKNYNQANLNLYVELLGQKTLDLQRYFVDLAPSVQLIFNSTAKLNVGYRFQLESNMKRMSANSWQFGFEWLFLDALK